jgi:dihydroflavonol-4-reductase
MEGQLDDENHLAEAMTGCDGLAHIAGAAGRFYSDPGHYHSVNVDLTRSVYGAARKAGITRSVVCGTVVIQQGLDSPYSISKRMAVEVAYEVAGEHMSVAVVHPSGMVGPGDRAPTPLGRGLQQFADGKIAVALSGGGGFVHVDDAAEMHVAALEQGASGQEFVANAEYLTLKELFAGLSAALDVKTPWGHLPAWAARGLVSVLDPVCRWLGLVPPMTKFGVSYLQQDPASTPDGSPDRRRLGLPPYRSVEAGCLAGIEWQRGQRV